MRVVLVLCIIESLLVGLWAPSPARSEPAPTASEADAHLAEGLSAFQRGAFERAVSSWVEAVRLYEKQGKPEDAIGALLHLSRAYQAIGEYKEALKRLETALTLARALGDPKRTAAVLAGIGGVYGAIGPPEKADQYLRDGLRLAREIGDPGLAASILNNLGNLLATRQRYAEAIAAYQESADLADGAGQKVLSARARTNSAMASRQNGQPLESRASLDRAVDQIRALTPSHDNSYGLINIGLAYRDLRSALQESRDALLLMAAGVFREAGVMAEAIGDPRAASYAWGHLGALYEDERRYAEALTLTRQAIFAAQQVSVPESLYRWQWQSARLFRASGDVDEAVAAYRRAVDTVQGIRPELSATYGGGGGPALFRDAVGPLFFELVDLLLQRAASFSDPDQERPYLVEARETVELFKVAELRNYFRDDCVDLARARIAKLDVVSYTAVVIYPILLPTRTELLVSSSSTGLRRVAVPVGADTLTREVRELRRKLEKRTTREYLPHAQQLYDWLIRPIESELASARPDTLVFVPDGPLRTIPMAALHDGEKFLISKYAVATTPGMTLTDPRPLNRVDAKVLAVGVAAPVQGFPPLPNVRLELQAIQNLFGSTTLLNREFLASSLEKKLRDERFTIVHIASHGQFDSDVDKTFLLTFDDKLTMNRLDQFVGVFRFRDEPLELLTLSACDTATGDDRAALGLAGVAIKAGARSAIATLWYISDEASAELMVEFYRQLHEPGTSRALALQRAQLKFLDDPRYDHPGYWSPFLLINNWL